MSFIHKKVSDSVQSDGVCGYIHVIPSTLPITHLAFDWIIEPCYLPDSYLHLGESILNFPIRKDDIWILSFPKSGTALIQEIIWLLNNNLDFPTAKRIRLRNRHIYLESEMVLPSDNPYLKNILPQATATPSPRFFKSYLPVGLLPTQLWTVKPKMIYLARNPKDVAVSFYYHLKTLPAGFARTFHEYMETFLKDHVVYAPFHSHILNFWSMRSEENILFVTYEQMKTDMLSVLKRAAQFLHKTYTDLQLREVQNYMDEYVIRVKALPNASDIADLATILFANHKIPIDKSQ